MNKTTHIYMAIFLLLISKNIFATNLENNPFIFKHCKIQESISWTINGNTCKSNEKEVLHSLMYDVDHVDNNLVGKATVSCNQGILTVKPISCEPNLDQKPCDSQFVTWKEKNNVCTSIIKKSNNKEIQWLDFSKNNIKGNASFLCENGKYILQENSDCKKMIKQLVNERYCSGGGWLYKCRIVNSYYKYFPEDEVNSRKTVDIILKERPK